MVTSAECDAKHRDIWGRINDMISVRTVQVIIGLLVLAIGGIGSYTLVVNMAMSDKVESTDKAQSGTAVKVDALTGNFQDFRTEQRIMNRDLMTAIKDIDKKIDDQKPD